VSVTFPFLTAGEAGGRGVMAAERPGERR
jgi:hypothetical protein